MVKKMKTADETRVYRFHDMVAFHAEGITPMTDTVYLTPKMAAQLAEALQLFVNDISCVKFTDSTLSTVKIKE